ncbi:MAG: penicillin-binding protein 1A [Bradymonadia bacterium]
MAGARPSLIRRLLKWALISSLVLMLLGVGTLVGGYIYFSRDLPDLETLDDYQPPQVTRIYADDGKTLIAELFTERRTVVPRKDIPDVMVKAMLAAEDADFYEHEGLDYMGMARALWKAVRSGRIKGGGSTITQQTVKTFLLSPEKTVSRKAKELILARRIEEKLTKDEILYLYLNQIYFGHGRYGVQEAARFYFGKDIGQVNLEEAALIAGLVQSPNRLSPFRHPDRAFARRTYVLDQMGQKGFAPKDAVDAAKGRPIKLVPFTEVNPEEAGWFVDAIRRQLVDALKPLEIDLYTAGLRVETTLNLDRQKMAMKAVLKGLRGVDARQKYTGKLKRLDKAGRTRWLAKRAQALGDKPPARNKATEGVITQVSKAELVVSFGVGTATIPTSTLNRFRNEEKALPFQVGHVVPVKIRDDGPSHPEQMHASLQVGPQGALVVIDPVTRDVKAMVGGDDHGGQPFNRAMLAKRQPGSAFKPFVWGAAYETARFTPATVMLDAPETWPMHGEKWWKPRNYTQKYRGPMRLKEALAKSVNSIAVKLLYDVKVPTVQRFARNAGIESPLTDNLTLALGSSEVSPLELANAYATIASGGRRGPPRMITAIEDAEGRPVETPLTAPWSSEEMIAPEVAWLLRETMRGVVRPGGSAYRAFKSLDRPIAGKTGTTNEARDLWFVGLLPEAVMVGWVGFDDRTPVGRKETGGKAAAPIVRAYVDAAASDDDLPGWPDAPEGVEQVTIDKESGLRAPPGAKGVDEYFLAGTAPKEVAHPKGTIDAGNFFMEDAGGGWDVRPVSPTPVKPVKPAPDRPSFDPEDLPQ